MCCPAPDRTGSLNHSSARDSIIRILVVVDREHGHQDIEWLAGICRIPGLARRGDRGLRTHHADGSLQFSRVGFRRDTVIVQVILGLVDAIEILGVAKLQDLAVAEPRFDWAGVSAQTRFL